MRKFWLTAYPPEIQRELFGIGHHNLAGVVPSGIVLMLLVYLAVGGAAPTQGLHLWLACAVLARVLALVLWLRFRAAARAPHPSPAAVRRWMWSHAATMSLLGLSIGLFGALFVPAEAAARSVPLAMHNLFLTMAFLGSVAYSAAGNGPHDLPAFLISVTCAAAAMLACVPGAYGAYAVHVAGLCLVFTVLMLWVAVKAHRLLLDTITLRLANEQLARNHAEAAAQARQANLDKSDFLAAASHDLRQPVHALVLLVEALRQRRALPRSHAEPVSGAEGEQDQLIGSIGEAAHAISHLFGGLMELSRLESGREQPQPTVLQPAALLRQVLARHTAQAEQQGLRLRARVARSAEAAWVHTDRVMLERCLGNLLANALRYTAHGGVLVTLRVRPASGALALTVHDTGSGIAAVNQTRIFEPYVQLGNAERDRRQGLGLGLAIVRQCTERLGLALRLRSAPGKGSAFTLELPAALRCAAPEAAQATTTATSRADAPALSDALAGRRVLLIDDDPMVCDAMRRLLAGWHVDLRVAGHGEDPALAELARQSWAPEAVLCDHRLPGGQHGLALLDRLQDRWPGSSAVLLTGEPPERVQAQAEEAGYPVLYKPVPAALLHTTLLALLSARSAAAGG
ncbi:MAG: ATP-binding protein [Burkholderiales bacterium]